ncbi:MAG TPA: STAS domain-containing protein [Armatimonadota bacterium]
MELNIQVRKVDDVAVVVLSGELDTYSCPNLRQSVGDLVDQGHLKIVLNLKDVEYVDSAGLGTLVGNLKRVTEKGGQLKLVNCNAQIQKVFNITGLVRIFEQYDSEEAAIKSFPPS